MCSVVTAPARSQGICLLALLSLIPGQAVALPVTAHELEVREQELTNLLQAQLETYKDERSTASMRFFLGKGSEQAATSSGQPQKLEGQPQEWAATDRAAVPERPWEGGNEVIRAYEAQQGPVSTTDQALGVPMTADQIPPSFWKAAGNVLNAAGVSTPIPSAASINAPPPPPTPVPFEEVMQEPAQPLDTKVGGAIIYKMAGGATPTPPPTQDTISSQFIAQCPMVLFNKDLSVRGQSCGAKVGRWVDPTPFNPNRTVLAWQPAAGGGLSFGVNSALTGPGSALFADISQQVTLTGYKFTMRNCLGVDRWHLEENVYKVDSMGRVSSTVDLSDVTMNSQQFFLKYQIRLPGGMLAAESGLFRTDSNQINFTEWKDGRNTGNIIAIVTRQGEWQGKGWEACMAPTSPRGWSLNFPQDQKNFATAATVQDIRVAIAGAVTLLGFRDEARGKDGLNTQGRDRELAIGIGGLALIILLCILSANFCMVFRQSGLRDKVKTVLFDSQGVILPKRPYQHREPMMHPSY